MEAFILFHVVLSLAGILSGFVVLAGLISDQRLDRWTAIFLATTVATSLTAFCFFPFDGFTRGQVVAILSMVLLSLAIFGRYARGLSGGWRKTYVISAVASLYLNCFVLIVQSFEKVPALKAAAPTQADPPFKIAQGITLVLFVVAGIFAAKRFRGGQPPAAVP